MIIVVLAIARVSVLEAPVPALQETSTVSSQIPCLIRCLIIAIIMPAKERVISIVTMVFINTAGSFPRFGTTGDINACKRELRLSLPKHLIKLLADDLQHQIDHTHGRTASLENSF